MRLTSHQGPKNLKHPYPKIIVIKRTVVWVLFWKVMARFVVRWWPCTSNQRFGIDGKLPKGSSTNECIYVFKINLITSIACTCTLDVWKSNCIGFFQQFSKGTGKLTNVPYNGTIAIGNTSSNHQFSGNIRWFTGCFLFCHGDNMGPKKAHQVEKSICTQVRADPIQEDQWAKHVHLPTLGPPKTPTPQVSGVFPVKT